MFSPDIWFCSILTFIRFFFSFFSYGQVVKKSLEKAAEQQLDSNKLLVTKSKWNAVANFSKFNSVNLSHFLNAHHLSVDWIQSDRKVKYLAHNLDLEPNTFLSSPPFQSISTYYSPIWGLMLLRKNVAHIEFCDDLWLAAAAKCPLSYPLPLPKE